MNQELLLRHFNRISDAPDAIPRLRQFVLDLAVRGKLVEYDPQDEPASKLLIRVRAEKMRLADEGLIRTSRTTDPPDAGEELFSIPAHWVWCSLSQVGAIVGGGTPPSTDSTNFTDPGSGVAWLTPADLGKHIGSYVSRGARDLTKEGLRASSATVMPKGSILFTSRAPIGYTAIAQNDISTNQGFKSVVPYIPDCNLYIAVYFRAFRKWIDSRASGTTFREVSGKIVANLPFPLPPLAEQRRIVAKVDELMGLCDQFESAQKKRESRRDQLATVALHRIDTGINGVELRKNAQFYCTHIHRLTTHKSKRPDLAA